MLNKPRLHGRRLSLAVAVSLAVLASACGGGIPLTASSDSDSDVTQPAAGASSVGALAGDSEFGRILVGPNGLTLYGFTNDTAAASTCFGTCAEAWPPVIVGEDWTVDPELDAGIFATTTRDDGQLQLVAGKWPLYYYIEDVAPGDVTGQLSGDVWFVVGLDGRLIEDAPTGDSAVAGADAEPEPEASDDAADVEDAPATAADGSFDLSLTQSQVGTVIADPSGRSLYGFTEDAGGAPTCVDDCAAEWPPVIVTAMPDNLNVMRFSVVERADGTLQLKSGKWPLYYFSGDSAPGDINGQGAGGTWFLVDVDGELVQSEGGAEDDGYDN